MKTFLFQLFTSTLATIWHTRKNRILGNLEYFECWETQLADPECMICWSGNIKRNNVDICFFTMYDILWSDKINAKVDFELQSLGLNMADVSVSAVEVDEYFGYPTRWKRPLDGDYDLLKEGQPMYF